jgi:hypothetical protein
VSPITFIRTYTSDNDGSVIWNANTVVQSDILLALCEYKGPKGKPKKKFRLSFHAGFIGDNLVMKLSRSDLDVDDKR